MKKNVKVSKLRKPKLTTEECLKACYDAVEELKKMGEPITYGNVSKLADVSISFVKHNEEIKKIIKEKSPYINRENKTKREIATLSIANLRIANLEKKVSALSREIVEKDNKIKELEEINKKLIEQNDNLIQAHLDSIS